VLLKETSANVGIEDLLKILLELPDSALYVFGLLSARETLHEEVTEVPHGELIHGI
jgi:hypothetical protein